MAAISEAQESNIAQARSRVRQDKRVPFLIHIDDGRLMPHTPLIAKNPKYRPYLGKHDASEAERRAYLKTLSNYGMPAARPVDTSPVGETAPQEPFVVAKATREELIAFAFDQFQVALDASEHLNALRAKVVKLAQQRDGDLG